MVVRWLFQCLILTMSLGPFSRFRSAGEAASASVGHLLVLPGRTHSSATVTPAHPAQLCGGRTSFVTNCDGRTPKVDGTRVPRIWVRNRHTRGNHCFLLPLFVSQKQWELWNVRSQCSPACLRGNDMVSALGQEGE